MTIPRTAPLFVLLSLAILPLTASTDEIRQKFREALLKHVGK